MYARALRPQPPKQVPAMTLDDANRLRRFITLVDCLYEHGAQLVLLAEAAPAQLFDTGANKGSGQDEAFAYDRTVSRLMEMQVRPLSVRLTFDLPASVSEQERGRGWVGGWVGVGVLRCFSWEGEGGRGEEKRIENCSPSS